MQTMLLIIHLLVCLGLIGLVLMQRSEGGALGIGGGGGNAFLSGRGAASALARATTVAGIIFFCTSIMLALFAGRGMEERTRSVTDAPAAERSAPVLPETAPTEEPAAAAPAPDVQSGLSIAPPPAAATERAGPAAAAAPIATPEPRQLAGSGQTQTVPRQTPPPRSTTQPAAPRTQPTTPPAAAAEPPPVVTTEPPPAAAPAGPPRRAGPDQ